jgi:filamentous hemagglutinin family protein
MRHTLNLGWLWLLASFAIACFPVRAEVVPDATLGAGKNSVTTTQGNRTDITGGLRRNSALFHSFDRFNIDTNRQVYFANPTGIRNIFSRVTGGSASSIDGLLGVNGGANLFLMNPKGIIFGPNARLDVSGSFLATTASVLEFADGQRFAADGDRAVPLVEVNIPIGLQIAANSPAMLNNQGNLAVGAGQSLTLAGGNTTHTGALTAPGGTVQVLGNQVALTDQARVDVSSPTGGGTVLIGGDYQGRGSLLNSTQTTVGPGVTIAANATAQGNGGKVIVWSDGHTQFGGSISAQGGPQGGNGGFVETSGKQTLAVASTAKVNVATFQGQAGTWLLDPTSITIIAPPPAPTDATVAAANANAGASTIDFAVVNTALGLGNVNLTATNFITVDPTTNLSIPATRTLSLNAATVNLNAPIAYAAGTSVLAGNPTTVNVGAAGRIQNGVDVAANNAAVNVTAGNRTENVTVNNKPLSLAFNGAGTNLTGSLTTNNASPVTLSGNLSSTGTQTYNAAVTIANPTTLTANGATVRFANTINAGGNALSLAAGTIDLGGDFTGTNASSLTLNSTNTLQLGSSDITTGSLNITASSAIVSTGNLTVSGTTTLNAPGNDITLDQGGNNFNTVQITSGRDVTLRDSNALDLGTSNVTGTLTVNAGGNITDSGTLTVNNATTLTATGSDIVLNQLDNEFSSVQVTSARNVTLNDSTGLTLNAINTTGDTIDISAAGILDLRNNITAADFGTITLRGGTVSANLGASSVTARAGTVNLLGPTINLNSGTINVPGVPASVKPTGGTVRLGSSFVDPILSNSTAITVDGGGPLTINASGAEGAAQGDVFIFTNSPTNVQASLINTGGLVVNGRLRFNNSNVNFGFPFADITVTNGDSVVVGGNTIADLFIDGANHLFIAETFLESISGLLPTTGLSAANQFTIDPLTTDGTLTLAGVPQFSAGRTFTMRAADTIVKTAGNFEVVVGNPNVFDASASLTAGAIRTAGGRIDVRSAGSLAANNTLTTSGGNLTLAAAGNLTVQDGLNTAPPGVTRGGDVSVTAQGSVNVLGNAAVPSTGGITTAGGSVAIGSATGTVNVTNRTINTSLNNNSGGNVALTSTDGNVNFTTSQITSFNEGAPGSPFSTIRIESINQSVNLTSANITAANVFGAVNPGFAGDILLNAGRQLNIATSNISTNGNTGRIFVGSSNAGGIGAAPQTVAITNSFLTTSNQNVVGGTVNSGDILVRANNPNPNLPGINIQTSQLSTDTAGSGEGGSVSLRSTSTNLTSTTINAGTSSLLPTAGSGGSISVGAETTVPNVLTFANTVNLDNSRLNVQTDGAGIGGNIDVQARAIAITNNSILNAGVLSTGDGGTIAVDTNGGSLALNNSLISAAVDGGGDGQTITIDTGTLSLLGGARVQSQTSGTGNAGDIQLNVETSLTAAGRNSFGRSSGVLASSEGLTSGRGGRITINDTANPRGEVSLSDSGFLAANTRGSSDGGDITLNVANLNLATGGQVLTAAAAGSSGRAGSIVVNATGGVTIADAVAPVATSSPFDTLGVTALNDLAFQSVNSPGAGGFAYFGFNVAAGNSQGTFDIDGGFKLGAGSIDTQVFLFSRATGTLLDGNDDSSPVDPGSIGLPFSTLTRDSLLNYTFAQPGAYVIGVGAFPSFVSGAAPIQGAVPAAGQTYTLNVTLTAPGTGGAFNPTQLNPNLPLDSGLFASGLYASSRGSGAAGSVTVTTPNLALSNQGTIAASNVSSAGQDIRLQGLNNLNVTGNSQITASTNTGVAGNVIITANQGINPTVNLVNSRVEAAAKQAGGSAGGVTIAAPTVVVNGATVSAANISSPTGGDVTLQGLNTLQVLNGGTIEATTQNGAAGNVNVAAGTSVQLNNGSLSVQATGTGQAGTLTVTTPALTVENGGRILATTRQGGSTTSGNIVLQGLNTLDAKTNGLISASTESGVAGNIAITATQGNNPAVSLNNAKIEAAATLAGGRAGGVTLTTPTVLLTEATIAASNVNAASGGNITFNTLDTLTSLNSVTSASTQSGVAGGVSINQGQPAARSVSLTGTRTTGTSTGSIIATATAGGNAGSVEINTANLDVKDGGSIAVSSANGAGTAGGVNVTATTVNLTNGAEISAETDAGGATSPANITLQGLQTLNVNNSAISSSTNSGQAGSVSVTATQQVNLNNNGRVAAEAKQGGSAGSVSVTTPNLDLANGGAIAASSANGAGRAGGVNVTAATVNVNNGTISAETDAGGAGSPANITLQGLQTLNVNNGAISSSTNSGQAGSVTVNAAQQVNLNNNGRIAAEARQGGSAGSVSVTTPDLQIANGGTIAASSANGAGTAGDVNVTAARVNLTNGTISAETDAGGATSPANITLQGLQTLNVNNGAISSSTNSGQAGSVTVTAAQQVNLSNNGRIAAEARQGGSAGSVSVTTPDLQIANGGAIAASSRNGTGTAGGVNVTASNVNLNSGAQISAETDRGGSASPANIKIQGLQTLNVNNSAISSSTNSGQAGSVTVNAAGQVVLDNNGRIAAEARQGGVAGNVDITANNVLIRNGGQATVSSPNGQAGNLSVSADRLRLDRGTLSATTGAGGNGANITLQVFQTPLFVRNGSLISANAGDQANGGNITITAPFVIGQTFENSDIVANAIAGSGGKIVINTNAIFGLAFRPKLTPRSDITASSESGSTGIVTLNTLNIDPARGLTQLPTDLVDRSSQIAQGCSVGGNPAEKESRFTIAGRGGVQLSPTALLPAQAGTSDWVGLDGPSSLATEPRFPDGSLLVLQPGQTYQVQVVCVNSWKIQQRSNL